MGKLLQPKRTKGKATDKVVFDILVDIYMKDKAYKIISEVLRGIWDTSWKMWEEMAKLNAEKWVKMIDTKSDDPFKELNIHKFTQPLLQVIQPLSLQKRILVLSFLETPLKATDLTRKYNISYDTLKKRLQKYFNFIDIPQGKTRYKALVPIPWVLFFLCMVEYFEEKNKEYDSLLVDIINLFNHYK